MFTRLKRVISEHFCLTTAILLVTCVFAYAATTQLTYGTGTVLDTLLNYLDPNADGSTGDADLALNSANIATSLEIPVGNDTDVDAEGEISWDANGDVLRGFDGTVQVAMGRKTNPIHITVIAPNDLADAERDDFPVWKNTSGMSFVVTGWDAESGTDDTALEIEEIDNDGGNRTLVDAVTIATDGTGLFYATDATITAATIETGHKLRLDFDDTDTPTYVQITIYGHFLADVN